MLGVESPIQRVVAARIDPDTPERASSMGLLPCLRRGSSRWWLPLSVGASEVLASIMIAQAGTPASDGTPEARLRAGVCERLRLDPPLLIQAALEQPRSEVTLGELADWWIRHATARFAGGDAFLDAPDLGPAQRRHFRKLRDHFRTLPLARWLEDAGLWLEVLGPPVPPNWREDWPRLILEDEADEQESAAAAVPPVGRDSLLQQLARMSQRQRSLEQTFAASVKQAKLEAVKQLAYGLSHEINNPLANISTRAQQLKASEADAGRAASLQRIVEQVYRAHEMIADLMFYANPPEAQLQLCDLSEVVRSVVAKFEPEASRQAIDLKMEAAEAPVEATVDEAMIGEALGVLIRNAIEAIGDHGTIVVALRRQDDQATTIEVADSGPGLSAQARQHAFDPYFSGREAGRGLGLGLCRAYRVAKLHGADVELTAAPAGCVARLMLPNSG